MAGRGRGRGRGANAPAVPVGVPGLPSSAPARAPVSTGTNGGARRSPPVNGGGDAVSGVADGVANLSVRGPRGRAQPSGDASVSEFSVFLI